MIQRYSKWLLVNQHGWTDMVATNQYDLIAFDQVKSWTSPDSLGLLQLVLVQTQRVLSVIVGYLQAVAFT